jgi:hypothetical protein
MMTNQRAGRELGKDTRRIVNHLIDTQGWRYQARPGRHPVLYPADHAYAPIVIAGTPSDHRAFANLKAMIRRAGGTF